MPRATMLACLASAAGVVLAPQPSQAGDPQRGEDLFDRCAVCHTVEPGQHRMGPSLAGVVGRPAASAEGFSYSPAMQASEYTGQAETSRLRAPA